MENRFDLLERELYTLGYKQRLHPDCVPLVGKLLDDLKTTTVNLEKYIRISQDAIEERDNLELGAEPYKCDNARLLRQCSELHSAFIDFKHQHEQIQKDLRSQISDLQSQLDNCILEKNRLLKQIQKFEREKAGPKKGLKLKVTEPSLRQKEKDSMNGELKDIQQRNRKLLEENKILHNELQTKDGEIKRLEGLLEAGRSHKSMSKECCFRNVESKLSSVKEECETKRKENAQLQTQLKEALAKQHEAMRRAIHLAERNQQLENELKEIDNMALTVEEQANINMKDSAAKVIRLQQRLNQSLEDNKTLTNKINNFTIIEHDLNMEIDRLTDLTAKQKRHIVELEAVVDNKKCRCDEFAQTDDPPDMKKSAGVQKGLTKKADTKPMHKKSTKATKTSTKTSHLLETVTKNQPLPKCCCESSTCIQHLKNLLDKEMEYRQASAVQTTEAIKQEKEYYMKEYHKLLENLRNIPTHEKNNECKELQRQLDEREKQIRELKNEIDNLTRERQKLMTKSSGFDYGSKDTCNNALCKRKERELDIVRTDLKHIQLENESLKNKLQAINESTTFNEERMKKAFQDMESHIRKLEDERRDLVRTEVTQRSNLTQIEEDFKNLKEQLRATQSDLNHQKANYNQLKLLHEQTDRALTDAQNQVIRAQTELATYQSKVKDSGRESASYEKEISRLNSDVQIMKNQLTRLDREKDELVNQLDEKTEKIALLEEQLRSKGGMTDRMEAELKELRRKLSKSAGESSSQDQLLRNTQQELILLENNIKKERHQREAAELENKRLQADLASLSCDCREARKELEIAYRQIDDLKRQLQHYVAEIKRTEDLISHKEVERNELLDQFKYLSQEANVLESTNHTLESEANQTKIQLSVALDHSSELERKIDNQQSVIQSYERQITELTNQVASLELQLKRATAEQGQYTAELRQMRDLCVKLDKEKDNVKNELHHKEDHRSQISKAVDTLRTEKEALERALEKERNNLQSVEKLLSDARQEAIDIRLLNQDLRSEVDRLKEKVKNLQERLVGTAEQLNQYQGKALEYSQQNKQLRREIADERFAKASQESKVENEKTCREDVEATSQEARTARKADHIAYADPVSHEIFQNVANSTKSLDYVIDQQRNSVPVIRTDEKFDFQRFYEMGSKEPEVTAQESSKTRRNSDLNKKILSDPAHPIDVHFECPSNSNKQKLCDPHNVDLHSEIMYHNETKSARSFPHGAEDDNPESIFSTGSETDVKRTYEKFDLRQMHGFPELSTTTDQNADSNQGDVVFMIEVPEPTDLIQLKSPTTTRTSFNNKVEQPVHVRNTSHDKPTEKYQPKKSNKEHNLTNTKNLFIIPEKTNIGSKFPARNKQNGERFKNRITTNAFDNIHADKQMDTAVFTIPENTNIGSKSPVTNEQNSERLENRLIIKRNAFGNLRTPKEFKSLNLTNNGQKMEKPNIEKSGKACDIKCVGKKIDKPEFNNYLVADKQNNWKNNTEGRKQRSQPSEKDNLLNKDTPANFKRGCNFENCWSRMSFSEPILLNTTDTQDNQTCITNKQLNKPQEKDQLNKPQEKDRRKDGNILESENRGSYLPHYSAYLSHPSDEGENYTFDKCKSSKNSENSKRRTSGDIVMIKDDTPDETRKIQQLINEKPTLHQVDCETNFAQESDSSAIFRKVFCVDGVGVECCCSISGYKTNDKI